MDAAEFTELVVAINAGQLPRSAMPVSPEVEGNVDLGGLKVEWLPSGLRINGSLDTWFSDVSVLPDQLWVRDTLNLGVTEVIEIPPGTIASTIRASKSNNGSIRVCSGVTVQKLFLSEADVELPDGFKADKIVLMGVGNAVLPKGIEARVFDVRDSWNLCGLPDDIVVHEELLIGGTQIICVPSSVPDNVRLYADGFHDHLVGEFRSTSALRL